MVLTEGNYSLWASNIKLRLRAASLLNVFKGGQYAPEEELNAFKTIMGIVDSRITRSIYETNPREV